LAREKGRLFDLDAWRRATSGDPDASFRSALESLRSQLYEQLPKLPLRALRDSLEYYQAERPAILHAYPELEDYGRGDPVRPEEQQLALCEMVLPLLLLEMTRREANPDSPDAQPFKPKPNVAEGPSEHTVGVLDRHGPEMNARLTIIRQCLRGNPRMSAEDLCKRLDCEDHPPPEEWREKHGVTTWFAAYRKPELRDRIQSMLSKLKREIRRLTDLPS
jgi:hypothetical protein